MTKKVDIQSLTLGEMAFFEDQTGGGLELLGAEGSKKGRAIAVLVYLFKRREDSNFGLSDAEQFTLPDAMEYLNLNDTEDDEEGNA